WAVRAARGRGDALAGRRALGDRAHPGEGPVPHREAGGGYHLHLGPEHRPRRPRLPRPEAQVAEVRSSELVLVVVLGFELVPVLVLGVGLVRVASSAARSTSPCGRSSASSVVGRGNPERWAPRSHLVRYHGVFGPASAWRSQIVPRPEEKPGGLVPRVPQRRQRRPGRAVRPPASPGPSFSCASFEKTCSSVRAAAAACAPFVTEKNVVKEIPRHPALRRASGAARLIAAPAGSDALSDPRWGSTAPGLTCSHMRVAYNISATVET